MRRLREYPGVSMKTTLNEGADPRAPAFSRFLALERSVGIRARRVCTNFPSFNSYSVHSSPTLCCVDRSALPKKAPRQLDLQCCYSLLLCRSFLHPLQHGSDYFWLTAAASPTCALDRTTCVYYSAPHSLPSHRCRYSWRQSSSSRFGSKTQTTVRACTAAYHVLRTRWRKADTRASNSLLYNICHLLSGAPPWPTQCTPRTLLHTSQA